MSAFAHSIMLQWKLDVRNKGVFITYYVVPLIFFIFMGGVLHPLCQKRIRQSYSP
jgi:ABC-2 type transport system permease protein